MKTFRESLYAPIKFDHRATKSTFFFLQEIVPENCEALTKFLQNVSDRRVPYSIPADWKALWFSNLDDLQRVNDANDNNTVSNVTVQLGGTAFLHCKVRNLADRTVSDAEVSDSAAVIVVFNPEEHELYFVIGTP